MSTAGGAAISTEQLKARYIGTGKSWSNIVFFIEMIFDYRSDSCLPHNFFTPTIIIYCFTGHADMSK